MPIPRIAKGSIGGSICNVSTRAASYAMLAPYARLLAPADVSTPSTGSMYSRTTCVLHQDLRGQY
eukprot:1964125-Rhodomonas_salina.2